MESPQANVITDDTETTNVAATYEKAGDLQARLCEAHWEQIERALCDVIFPGAASDPLMEARERLERLKARVYASHDPMFVASIYHLDAFQLAIDLADAAPASAEQTGKYRQMLRDLSGREGGSVYDRQLLEDAAARQAAPASPDDPALDRFVP